MNYITDGTFWVMTIVIFAVIGAVHYKLKKYIDETDAELERVKKILINGSRELAKIHGTEAEYDTKKYQKEQREKAFVLNTFGDIYEIISILQKSAKPKDQEKINKIASRTDIKDYDIE